METIVNCEVGMKYEIRTLADIFNKVPADKIELCMAEIAASMVMGKGTLGMMEITGQWPDVVEWIDDGAGNVGAEIVIGDDVLEIESRKIPFFSEKSRIAELEAENQALRVACISIFNDYVEWEVRKLPPATQDAWEIGKEYVEKELKGEGL